MNKSSTHYPSAKCTRYLRSQALLLALILLYSFSLAQAQDNNCSDYRCQKEPRRFALVIGNSNYRNLTSIPSSTVDAQQVSQRLRELHFDVEEHYDVLTPFQFWQEIYPAFRQKLTTGDFIVFYFSGHGFSNGANSYIAPTELPLQMSEQNVTDYAIAIQSFRSRLEDSSPALILFIVDACLSVGDLKVVNNKNQNTITKGPASMNEEFRQSNALIVYATEPGKESQGTTEPGQTSPFTGKLVANITAQGTPFLTVFRQVAAELAGSTNPQQIAHTFLSSRTDPYLNPTEQNLKQDEELWFSALDNKPDHFKVDVFAQMNSVSRYLFAARKWLAENPESDVANSTSLASPIAIDRAWQDTNTQAAALRRLSAPLAFTRSQDKNLQPELRELSNAELGLVKSGSKPSQIAQLRTGEDFVTAIAPTQNLHTEFYANSLAYSLATINTAEIMVATSSLIGREQPTATAKVIETIKASTPLRILEIVLARDESPWIKATKPGSDSPFFFTFKPSATPPALELGRSALQILVPARPDSLPGLVDPAPIKEAISKLKAEGWKITWISVSTAATNNEKDQRLRAARLANAEYILRRSDLPILNSGSAGSDIRKRITSVSGTEDFSGDSVRIRFFGIKAN